MQVMENLRASQMCESPSLSKSSNILSAVYRICLDKPFNPCCCVYNFVIQHVFVGLVDPLHVNVFKFISIKQFDVKKVNRCLLHFDNKQ